MSPTPYMMHSTECSEEPISRTYQYRKVMKPMLERKRRARINRCLDELKELMVTALQNGGENVSKLEKADILELTVRHLNNLKRQHQLILPQKPPSYADKFREGFTQCAQEVTQFISIEQPGVVDKLTGRKLLQHLRACVTQLDCISNNLQRENYRHQSVTPPVSPSNRQNMEVHKIDKDPSMWRPW